MTAVLRECVERGDFDPVAELYASDAVLDASLPGARNLSTGPAAIVAFLESSFAGGGEVVEWTEDDHDEGAAIWLERLNGDGSATRQRQYLRLSNGAVTRHWIYAAPPRSTAPRIDDQPAPPLFERLGVVERDGFDFLPKQFEATWEAFSDAVPPDVAEPVLEIPGAPAALARERPSREATLILLDWGFATRGHPVVDLSWHSRTPGAPTPTTTRLSTTTAARAASATIPTRWNLG